MHIPGLTLDHGAESTLDSLPWRPTKSTGVEWIELASDPGGDAGSREGTMVVLIRMAPGRGYPRHEHLGPEDVLVLAGGYADDDGRTFRAGDFVRYPAGSSHTPVAIGDNSADTAPGNEACVLYSVAHGGTRLSERA